METLFSYYLYVVCNSHTILIKNLFLYCYYDFICVSLQLCFRNNATLFSYFYDFPVFIVALFSYFYDFIPVVSDFILVLLRIQTCIIITTLFSYSNFIVILLQLQFGIFVTTLSSCYYYIFILVFLQLCFRIKSLFSYYYDFIPCNFFLAIL